MRLSKDQMGGREEIDIKQSETGGGVI
jgi:hypothetical protein